MVVNKSVSLVGENRSTTIIDGNGTGSVVTVAANNTIITGFTIRESGKPPVEYIPSTDTGILVFADHDQVVGNTTITNNDIRDNYAGVFVWHSLENVVANNKIKNNSFGIGIYEAIYNNISHNTMSNNTGGIWLGSGGNNVSSNIISLNWAYGVQIDDSFFNTVDGNVIEHNGYGIELQGRSNNITENTIRNNECAISIGGSEDNSIYHNNFMNNTEQVEKGLGYYNIWDNGYSSGGNYWSDYNGTDSSWGPGQNKTGRDGIGDTPYVVDDNDRDNYPLMSPYEYWSSPIPGDINKDTKVNHKDLLTLAAAYGSSSDKPNWNPNTDMNEDGEVNHKDLLILASNYGKKWKPP